MNLGETIYRLRTQKNMSQGNLADALEISRQSVSKWENGNATPDLERLVKLARLFDITLDELVNGAAPTSPPAPEIPVQTTPVPQTHSRHQIWGIVLLATGLVAFLVLSLLGGILIGLLFAAPVLVPGVICLTAKTRAGLKCAWAEFFLINTFLSFTTGTGWTTLYGFLRNWKVLMEAGFNIFHPIVSLAENIFLLILLIWTVRSYNKTAAPLTKRGKLLLLAGWCLYLLTFIPFSLPIDVFSIWYRIVGELINWATLALLTVLLVFTRRLPCFHRK